MFKINDYVTYTYYKTGKIEKVHYDDPPELYYTINLGDRHPQTTKNNFILKNKINPSNNFDKDDEVIYFKNYDTKILDIKDGRYKISYNDKVKYVSEKRLSKKIE